MVNLSSLSFALATIGVPLAFGHRELVQGEGQQPCATGGCFAPNFGNVAITPLWVQHENIYWRCHQPGLVALTFDDGPAPNTVDVVNALDLIGIKATFFVNGNLVNQASGKLLAAMEKRGHMIAHHTFNHNSFLNDVEDAGGLEEFLVAEVDKAKEEINKYLSRGVRPYLRPPYTDMDEAAATALKARGVHVVQISVDTKDYANQDNPPSQETTDLMVSAFSSLAENNNNAANSYISLQHDPLPITNAVIPRVVELLKSGYKFVTVDECLNYPDNDTPAPAAEIPENPLNWNCIGDPCSNVNHCRSRFGFCDADESFCGAERTWDITCMSNTVKGCTGEPCDIASRCRSSHGFCGKGTEFCNEDSIWTSECATGDAARAGLQVGASLVTILVCLMQSLQ